MFGQWANFNSALDSSTKKNKTMSRSCLKAKLLQQALGRINFVINSQSPKEYSEKMKVFGLDGGRGRGYGQPLDVLHKVLSKCPA